MYLSIIAFSKKFKNYILDQISLIDYLYPFAIDKIYLIEKQGKNFQFIWAEIEKV